MIAFLHGEIADIKSDGLIVECQGLGYFVHMGLRDLGTLECGQRIKIHTELLVREDDVSLYGFLTPLDRELFDRLRGVSGIGAKTALSILGILPAPEIIQLIIEENHAFLTQVPGIGKKTAARIIVELRDSLEKTYGAVRNGAAEPLIVGRDPKLDEVRQALRDLGYDRSEISAALGRLDGSKDLEELLKDALKMLARW